MDSITSWYHLVHAPPTADGGQDHTGKAPLVRFGPEHREMLLELAAQWRDHALYWHLAPIRTQTLRYVLSVGLSEEEADEKQVRGSQGGAGTADDEHAGLSTSRGEATAARRARLHGRDGSHPRSVRPFIPRTSDKLTPSFAGTSRVALPTSPRGTCGPPTSDKRCSSSRAGRSVRSGTTGCWSLRWGRRRVGSGASFVEGWTLIRGRRCMGRVE